ncbi:MAG TPA: acyl-CoA dehydrogenase family protein [Polyangiaceae bacterium LLY-WYZ-14_1]|nr:acyl-CoA dehydrogenase family protein [Polyangiaceae bacterium LLY-WYZ-14_1]
MANFLKDNEDLRFYLDRGIDWGPLVDLTEHGFKGKDGFESTDEAVAFYKEILDVVGDFVADEVAPAANQVDREPIVLEGGEAKVPPALEEIFDKIKGLDLHGLSVPRELGGSNAPMMLYFLNSELFARADVSVMAHHGFHGGIASALLLLSMQEGTTRVDRETGEVLETRWGDAIAEILRGDAWGCMDITEPQAGSDMAGIKAMAEEDDQGRWFLTGQKIYITSGHGKWHFVIARTEGDDKPGLEGLSMFLVKTYEDQPDGSRKRLVTLDRIEEKLGHHGSATCALSFDRAPAELVGRRGEGFKYMLVLMNSARLGVGFECLGLLEAAHRVARDYAAERPSMGKTIDKHELIADYLEEMATDIQGLRALNVHAAWHEEVGQKLNLRATYETADELEAQRLRKQAKTHQWAARRATPLLKYFGAEKAVEHARRTIQILGGNGYTKDYPAEKLLRDAVVMPIYEGTSQIQALMAMKDTLGQRMKHPRDFVRRTAEARWRSLSSRDPLERKVARIQSLSLAAQQYLLARTVGQKFRDIQDQPLTEWPASLRKGWDPKRDFAYALLHAERLTRILTDELVAEILLEQAKAHPERRELLERWVERAEPRVRFLLDEITSTGTRLIERLRGDGSARPEDAAAAS